VHVSRTLSGLDCGRHDQFGLGRLQLERHQVRRQRPKTRTIGVANYTLAAPYFIAMSKAVQEEASTVGNVKVKVTDATATRPS